MLPVRVTTPLVPNIESGVPLLLYRITIPTVSADAVLYQPPTSTLPLVSSTTDCARRYSSLRLVNVSPSVPNVLSGWPSGLRPSRNVSQEPPSREAPHTM